MASAIQVRDLVNTFKSTYRTVDIRTAAVFQSERWINAFTVIRLSYENPSAARRRIRQLEETHEPLQGKHFRIETQILEFSDWDQVCDDLANGLVKPRKREIGLQKAVMLPAQAAQIHRHHRELVALDDHRWPALQVAANRVQVPKLTDDSVVREVVASGHYSRPYEAVSLLCQAHMWEGRLPDHELYVAVPVFAWISDIEVVPTDREARVTITRHRDLPDLALKIALYEHSSAGDAHVRKEASPRFRVTRTKGRKLIQSKTFSWKLPEFTQETELRAMLTHSRVGEIEVVTRRIRHLLPQEESNSLFEVLKAFCPGTELQELLSVPHEQKPKRLGESAGFELHVSWLLSLFGFSTIVLGDYERLYAPGRRVEYGSVDILAYSMVEHLLLLVACSLNPPKEEELHSLLHVIGVLRHRLLKGSTLMMAPLLFTGGRNYPRWKSLKEGGPDIPVIGPESIPLLLGLLEHREEWRFFSFLKNPKYNQLELRT